MLSLQGRAAGETWRTTEIGSMVASRKQSVLTQLRKPNPFSRAFSQDSHLDTDLIAVLLLVFNSICSVRCYLGDISQKSLKPPELRGH